MTERKARVTKLRPMTPEEAKRAKLAGISDEQVMCRAGRHPWPVLDPRKTRLPKGISALLQSDGCFQIREACPVCKKIRWYTTLPDAVFDASAQYRYEDPPDWVVIHEDDLPDRVTPRDFRAELMRRSADAVRTSARQARAESDGHAVPVNFKGPS